MDTSQKTWAIIGASRGIGYEFVKQLLERGDRVFATVRKEPSSFFPEYKDRLQVLTCDVADDRSINVGHDSSSHGPSEGLTDPATRG